MSREIGEQVLGESRLGEGQVGEAIIGLRTFHAPWTWTGASSSRCMSARANRPMHDNEIESRDVLAALTARSMRVRRIGRGSLPPATLRVNHTVARFVLGATGRCCYRVHLCQQKWYARPATSRAHDYFFVPTSRTPQYKSAILIVGHYTIGAACWGRRPRATHKRRIRGDRGIE